MPVDFVAIDFETANDARVSACAMGVAIVENGVIRSEHRLIRPPELVFKPMNISIHGITPDLVESAPSFLEVWKEFEDILCTSPEVWAHWAPFDKGVLSANFSYYGIQGKMPEVFCSCRLAKRTWPGLESYSLDVLARELRIRLNHHEAESDASACAEIVRIAREGKIVIPPKFQPEAPRSSRGLTISFSVVRNEGMVEMTLDTPGADNALPPPQEPEHSPDELMGICEGILIDGIVTQDECKGLLDWLHANPIAAEQWPGNMLARHLSAVLLDGALSPEESLMIEELIRSVASGIPHVLPKFSVVPSRVEGFDSLPDDASPKGKNFCFTGEFAFGERSLCERATNLAGGLALKNVTKKLDFLVIGTVAGDSWVSTKVAKATEYKGKGLPVRIIPESEWFRMVQAAE